MKFPHDIKVYGDTSYRGDCPQEGAEQVTFFAELRRRYPEIADAAIHPRNEGKRTYGQAAWQKAAGMNTGASDIVIPGCPAFVCELKRLDHTKSRWQGGQLGYLRAAQRLGAFVCVALGHRAALEALQQWIDQAHN